jgi:serine/threonine protein kinase
MTRSWYRLRTRSPQDGDGAIEPHKAAGPGQEEPADFAPELENTLALREGRVSRSAGGSGALPTGTLLQDRFEVVDFRGQGGVASVHRVHDRLLNQEVALKLLHEAPSDPAARARFAREMRICRTLDHPGIVRLWDFGIWRERPFCTMELLRGRTLGAALADSSGGFLPYERALSVGAQLAAAVDFAHDKAIVHRDIKPGNIFLVGAAQRVKLVDFGLATSPQDDSNLSTPDLILGTPAYLAPERIARGGPAKPASDIYSLGVVLFEALTGRKPFKAPSAGALLLAITFHEPPLLRSIRPELPEEMESLIARMLDKDPRNRPPSAGLVERRLRRMLEEL